MTDYYKVLGIKENASKDEIKKAYRSLSLKCHPDKTTDPLLNNKFNEINNAYQILGDETKKQEYDFSRSNSFMRMNSQSYSDDTLPEEIINLFQGFLGNSAFGFGNMPPSGNVRIFHSGGNIAPFGINPKMLQKPVPIIKTISVTIEQIFLGTQLPVEIERFVMQDGLKITECEILYVDIPQGTDDGELIILREKGHVIDENIKGDVKLSIKVINKTDFKRIGLDLILDKTIQLKEALCGFTFDIKYLNGKTFTVNNTKGLIISPEYKKKYENMGIKRGDHIGSMIIVFHIIFPEQLSREQILKISEIL
jgi:DnaJ-class molecular chaperone